ncbi:acyl-ACP--UDP-N-acetylglucosamine O-acyltransferase [Legionella bononiensis]|uniref:Acyl-[acyl-carrier-protein]--UDP-N-acetylglucosamine O-acyltransferase n=1 Tax=Legionella bononiensis TaxID=2793102 RepID=A0ABS1WFR0_9GAMM|nr:acyl-ACP--UDP-N-acetylglucosamine O-acyltransferase [Legionella bononiensis]MBL7481642.1 acyl-ACP--UDP-N-acetylglucosamine O-acyltransferase [Legionella bononiensis]MBL7528189.1 acyl-ACP--UDP-N-acetylglucosamine O-acyltransferase [Legionella bononiensis]MBL7562665.1 acyl-ACP--UDP-N-acetylglucosamine O-acyltransferase [Legionella bononiensis]
MLVSPLDHAHVPSSINPSSKGIHPTALIAPGAKIGSDVTIGPYSIIGEHVRIGQGTTIASHVTIEGWTQIGERNYIGIGSIIGGIPQDLKFKGEISKVFIGNDNVIREYVTINRGTAGGGGETFIGNSNVFMTYVHVAHDVSVGNNNIFSNSSGIAGHVVIEDNVTVGAFSVLHQFIKLGRMSMIGALSLITKDVTPFALVSGNPAKRYGLNIERLRRSGYNPEARIAIQRAYKILFHKGFSMKKAIEQLECEFPENLDIQYLIQFLHNSTRGIYR